MNHPVQATSLLPAGAHAADRHATLKSALLVISIGVLLIFAAGFGQAGALHDATHDIRHAHSLPCH